MSLPYRGWWARIGPDVRATVLLALPLIVGQLSTIGMNVVDVILAGHLSAHVLGAVAIGTSVWTLAVVGISGVAMAIPACVAQLDGARRRDHVWPLFRQALWLAGALGLTAGSAVRWLGPHLIELIGVTPLLTHDAISFLHAVCFAAPAIALFYACRGLSEGLSITRPTLYFSVLGLAVLGPLGYVLMYGKLGLPALGATGSGIATAIVCWIQAGAFLAYIFLHPRYRGLGRVDGRRRPDWQSIGGLLRIGLPMGVTITMEAGLFIGIALLIGRLGEIAIASHQVALSVATVAFMIPMGLGVAITVRVGNAAGRGDAQAVRRAGLTGIGLTLATQFVSCLLMLTLPGLIVGLYTRDAAVAAGAITLLQLAGLFQLSDGIQVSSNGALRGLKDTRIPMLITLVAYWGIGMPVGWWLAFERQMGPPGMWIGLIAGLSVAAVLLFSRFMRLLAGDAVQRCAAVATQARI